MLGTCSEKPTDPPSGRRQVPFHAQPGGAEIQTLATSQDHGTGLATDLIVNEEENHVEVPGGTIGVIFIIGLLVVIGLLMLVF